MCRLIPVTALLATALVFSGCNIRPDLGPPGTVFYQRHQAVVHDPFPSRTIGPEIEGARPMDFDRPLSEPTGQQTNPHARRNGYGF